MLLVPSTEGLRAAVPHAGLLWDVQLRSSLASEMAQAGTLARRMMLASWCAHSLLVVLLEQPQLSSL